MDKQQIQSEYDLAISVLAKPLDSAEDLGKRWYLEDLHTSLDIFRKQVRDFNDLELDRWLTKVTNDISEDLAAQGLRGSRQQAFLVAIIDEITSRDGAIVR